MRLSSIELGIKSCSTFQWSVPQKKTTFPHPPKKRNKKRLFCSGKKDLHPPPPSASQSTHPRCCTKDGPSTHTPPTPPASMGEPPSPLPCYQRGVMGHTPYIFTCSQWGVMGLTPTPASVSTGEGRFDEVCGGSPPPQLLPLLPVECDSDGGGSPPLLFPVGEG